MKIYFNVTTITGAIAVLETSADISILNRFVAKISAQKENVINDILCFVDIKMSASFTKNIIVLSDM